MKPKVVSPVSDPRVLALKTAMASMTVTVRDAAVAGDAAFALRKNLSFYDASYLTLAKAFSVQLLTLDKILERTLGGGFTRVEPL